jgi:hypothetical protein
MSFVHFILSWFKMRIVDSNALVLWWITFGRFNVVKRQRSSSFSRSAIRSALLFVLPHSIASSSCLVPDRPIVRAVSGHGDDVADRELPVGDVMAPVGLD